MYVPYEHICPGCSEMKRHTGAPCKCKDRAKTKAK